MAVRDDGAGDRDHSTRSPRSVDPTSVPVDPAQGTTITPAPTPDPRRELAKTSDNVGVRVGRAYEPVKVLWPTETLPSEKFAIQSYTAHQTIQNQELSSVRHNSNGKLRYSWAVDLDTTR